MSIDHNNIGRTIRELRLAIGMSQEELGKRIGVQRAAINKYEKGTVENIPLRSIERIAKVLGVEPNHIVGWNCDAVNGLAAEVRVIRGIQYFYGQDTVELVETYNSLRQEGRERLRQYADYLCQTYRDTKV